MRLVMLGLPAAGKGTQGKLLSERCGITHVSTGSVFRSAMRSESAIGREARRFIEQGALVPDELAAEIVKGRISDRDCQQGFVLDGFPRTVPQAESLEAAMVSLGMHLDAAINIQISEDEAIRRIANRRVCGQCGSTTSSETQSCPECDGPLVQRTDDTPEVARNRLVVYLAQTQPVVDFYRNRGCLVPVNGLQPVEQVYSQIRRRLSQMGVCIPGATGQIEARASDRWPLGGVAQ